MPSRSLKLTIASLVMLAGCAAVPTTSPREASPSQPVSADLAATRTTLQAPDGLGGQPLRQAPAYTDTNPATPAYDFTMNVSEELVPILPGELTRMLTYNGQFPGPTIRAKAGQRVNARVKNLLSVPITVHFHGMVIEPEHDGGPWNTISPGQEHTYTWVAKKDLPMSGWYHAHPHGMTHVLTPRGMMGTLEVLDPNDPLDASFGDDWLVLSDQKFTLDNQMPPDTEFDRFNGREGDHVFVNGQKMPAFRMKPGEVRRFRVLNAGPARYYKLAAPAGFTMYQVGTDGGLIERPYQQQSIVMGVAERVEILLKAPSAPGAYKLQSLPYDRGLGLRENFTRDLMTFIVEPGVAPAQPAIPMTLREIPPLDLTGARVREFELGAESIGQGRKHFVINEKHFDPLRIDNVAKLGDTEIYSIENKSGNWDHPMHLHSVQFQILDIDGVAPPFRAWKDVMNLPRSSRGRFAVRYGVDEFPGLFMFHCHILQHEDDGMMTHIMVNAPGSPAP